MEENKHNKQEKRDLHLPWLGRIFIRPKSTLNMVVEEKQPVWLAPLLLLTVFVIVASIFVAPVRRTEIQAKQTVPDDFMYWSQEQQTQYVKKQQNQTSLVFTFVFPSVSKLIGYWFMWFLYGSLLHLCLTLAGSRTQRLKTSNLVAWAMIPFVFRELVILLLAVFGRRLAFNTGLSSLIASGATGGLAFLRAMLGQIDLYWLLFVLLLMIAVVPLSGLKAGKARLTTAIVVLLMLVLGAIPSIVSKMIGGLSKNSSGFGF